METTDTTSPLVIPDTSAGQGVRHAPAEPAAIESTTIQLSQKLDALRSRHRWLSTWGGFFIVAMFVLAFMFAEMCLDWVIGFPMVVRALLLGLGIAGVAALARHRVLRPILQSPDDQDLALRVERVNPIFQSRLISAIQLALPNGLSGGASRVIADNMIRETCEIARSIAFDNVIDSAPVQWLGWEALAAFLAFALIFSFGMPVTTQLLERGFLSNIPVPHFTEVAVKSGSFILARGDTAHLDAVASRIIPDSGTVYVTYASGRQDVFALSRGAGSTPHTAQFGFDVVNAQESFDYHLKLNDNRTPTYHVDVESPPVITAMILKQQYPAYVQLPDALELPGHLSFVQGATLKMSVTSSSAMSAGASGQEASHVHLAGSEQDIPIDVDRNDPTKGTVSVLLPYQTNGLSVHLVDCNGLRNKDPILYPLGVVPDAPPTISLVYPINKDATATHRALFLLGFQGRDDFAIDTLTLHYSVDKGPQQTKSLEIKKGLPQLRGRFDWDLSTIAPPVGKVDAVDSVIEYWLEARDANTLTGPGVGVSEHYNLKIVTDAEKLAELTQAQSEILGGITQAAEDQKSVAATLGDIVLEKK